MATLNIQSAAAYTNPTGGTETIGPINVVGTITPLRTFLNLQSGNNSFTVPTGAVGAIITPPSTNTIVLKGKTTSGDVGVNLPMAAPSVILFDTANLPGTLYINAASATTGYTTVLFF